MKKTATLKLATAAVVGACYAVLTMILAPISYGAVQFRVSEALCILPFFMPCTAWGLFGGCIIANLLTGNIFSHPAAFGLNAAQVGLGEAAVLFVIGLPMMYYLPGLKFFREFTIKLND